MDSVNIFIFFIMIGFILVFFIFGVRTHLSLFMRTDRYKLSWEWWTLKTHCIAFPIIGLIYALNGQHCDLSPSIFNLAAGEILLFSLQEIISIFVFQSQIDKKRGVFVFEFQHCLLLYAFWAAGIAGIILLPYWIVYGGIALIMLLWCWLWTFFPSQVPMKVKLKFLISAKNGQFESISDIAPGDFMFKISNSYDRLFLTFLEHKGKEISKSILETCKKNIFYKYPDFTEAHQEKRQLAEIAYSHLMRIISHD